MFVEPADGLLQLLLLCLGEDVRELVAGLQEHAQDALVQLAEEVLQASQRVSGNTVFHGMVVFRNSVIKYQDEPW